MNPITRLQQYTYQPPQKGPDDPGSFSSPNALQAGRPVTGIEKTARNEALQPGECKT